MPPSKSTYADEVDKHFAPFKNHEAIKAIQSMRAQFGVSYDAPMSFAMHLDNVDDLKLLIDPKKPPYTFDSRWNPEATQAFLVKLRSFVKDSHFTEFIDSHRAFYDKATGSMKGLLAKYNFTEWFDKFYGPRPNSELYATVGLLAGGGNYGVSAQLPNGNLIVSPVIGVYKWDANGVPVFSDDLSFTLIHEFSHTYMNPLILKNIAKIQKAVDKMAKANASQFKSQAYQGGQTIACETMVRVATVLFTKQCMSETTAKLVERNEINSGFWWVDGMVKLFDDYKDRTKYPTLEAFMPRVIEYFNGVPKRLPELKNRMPQIVSMTPKNGSKNVASGTPKIKITYSMPVSLFNSKGIFWNSKKPLEAGTWELSEDKKTITINVRLDSNTEYKFIVYAVQSSEGYLPSTESLSFTTAK
jgi:hypothetical protein